MQEYIDLAQQFIHDNQSWAGLIVGLLTFGESLLIVGIMIPATTLLFFTGGLVGSGVLDPMPIILCGIVGAILGDWVSYWLGRWFGPSILRWGIMKRHRTGVARARLFFYRYGLVAVFIGRFLGPIRSTIPTVAGVMGMSHMRFQMANIGSAILWMPALLAPGYLAAKSVEAAHISGEMSLLIAAVSSVAIGVGIFYVVIRQKKSPSSSGKAKRSS